jgi:hypothetical protein
MARPSAGDLAKAKAAKQKKIAIGGSILLVALLAFQVPRTLKMMHPPQAASASSESATPTTPTTETTPAAPTTPTTDPAAATPTTPTTSTSTGAAGAMVLTAELSPAPREGQLAVFTSTFTTKDPFKPQADDVKTSSTDTTSSAGKGAATDGGTKGVTPTTGSTGTGATPTPSSPAGPLLSATISINGVEEGVNLDMDFPVATPLFHLVSLTSKSAKIAIAGGSLATGAPTITLKRGKTVTLMNTADGTRYEITLVATSTAAAVVAATTAPPAAAAAPATSASTAAPATTTTP